MSHELRTPLNAVIGYSQLLLDDAVEQGDNSITRDLESINGAGTHLLKLVNDILDFSKIEAGKMDVFPTRDNLKQRLAEIERIIGPILAERGYRFDMHIDGVDFLVETDWAALVKALTHFLTGAATSAAGGELRLRASRDGDFCVLEIEGSAWRVRRPAAGDPVRRLPRRSRRQSHQIWRRRHRPRARPQVRPPGRRRHFGGPQPSWGTDLHHHLAGRGAASGPRDGELSLKNPSGRRS